MPRPKKSYVLELPLPPSVNRLTRTWRGVPLGNKSPIVQAWWKEADIDLWQQKPWPHIKGQYQIFIRWPLASYGKWDWDNRIKILQDYLQVRGIIADDKNGILGSAGFFGDVEKGRCVVVLWPE